MRSTLAALLITVVTSTLVAGEWKEIDLSNVDTKGNWQEQADGTLYLEPRDGEEGWKRYDAYLWFEGEYEDFVCEFEYKHQEGGNSGFHFRVGDIADPVSTGLEIQLLDCYGKENLGFHDLGGLIKFVDRDKGAPKVNAAKPAGEWNKVQVRLENSKLTVVINGKTVQDELDLSAHKVDGSYASKGRIGIQDHGLPFWIRNIRIKRLGE